MSLWLSRRDGRMVLPKTFESMPLDRGEMLYGAKDSGCLPPILFAVNVVLACVDGAIGAVALSQVGGFVRSFVFFVDLSSVSMWSIRSFSMRLCSEAGVLISDVDAIWILIPDSQCGIAIGVFLFPSKNYSVNGSCIALRAID
ncbi:hypothetical protein ACLOJK_008437 [Asimina triloba]